MKLTIVVDNYCGKNNMLAEYGLSIHLRNDDVQVLMDTGQGVAIHNNLKELGIDVGNINHLVFSHGHFDHIWGAPKLLEKMPGIPVWAHPEFDCARYRKKEGQSQFIGSYIKKEDVNFNPIREFTKITDNIWAIEIPEEDRDPNYTPVTNHLSVYQDGKWEIDSFSDDVSLVVKGELGYSVVLGCAHAGVVNILENVSRRIGTKNFHCVVGGMHMLGQSEEYMHRVVDKLVNDYQVEKWVPAHCTGFDAAALLKSKVPNVIWGGVGTEIQL